MAAKPVLRRVGYLIDWGFGLAAQASTLLVAELLFRTAGVTRLGLLFLATVTITASIRGRRAAIAAAVIGIPAYKLFLDFRANESTVVTEDLLNLSVFLIVALVAGALAGRLHDEATKSRRRAERMEALFNASQVSAEETNEHFWQAVVNTLGSASGGPAFVISDNGLKAATAGAHLEPPAERVAVETLIKEAEGSYELDGWAARVLPQTNGSRAALVWQADPDDAELGNVVDLLAELTASSIQRAHAGREQLKARAAQEAARLRETLISSISHDFRTPLAAIIGSSTSLLEYGDQFDDAVRRDLLMNIHEEGERLNQFIANLLSMTRVQAGAISTKREKIGSQEIIEQVIARVERHHRMRFDIVLNGSCHLLGDRMLLEQALYNVIDNAAKYASPDHRLEITTSAFDERCQIAIADHGPGLLEEDQKAAFTKFHFAKAYGCSRGTGLGLSIVKGFVEAMHGTVIAQNRPDGQSGLVLTINLPRHRA